MKRFKSIILPMQGKNKSNLKWLYQDKYNPNFPEKEKIFAYGSFRFWFGGTSFRSSEKMILYIEIPKELLYHGDLDNTIACETYIIHILFPRIKKLSESYLNTDKNVREKTQFEIQCADEYVVKRSGIRYNQEAKSYILRVNFNVPLVNALSVNAKAAVRAVRDILDCIEATFKEFDRDELVYYVKTYERQQEIRRYMSEHELCAFVANGSILPRENGTSAPMGNATPFVSPAELEVTIRISDGTDVVGMGIKKGITVITGGGYSGKSTLLDSIEMGIYNHIPGDGREYVLTDGSALKIYTEDGRPVSELNMSPFFKHLPGNTKLTEFSTLHASGSVSQAASIIEAVCGKCKLLLIDEDKSATNFMIRDRNMRLILKNEPIIPFTDRIKELYTDKDVSTILVIGGSSEYLSYADTIILMEDFLPHVITDDVRKLSLSKITISEVSANWTDIRRLIPQKTTQPFLYFQNVETENEKKIILDEFSADITLLTAIVSGNQLNTLAFVMECLLTDKDVDNDDLLTKAEKYIAKMLTDDDTTSLCPESAQRFYENIRPIDAFCCANRMRGLHFRSDEDGLGCTN